MERKKTGKILDILFLSWFFLIPAFWHLDVSKGTPGLYDMFVMAPYGVFHLLIFYAIGATSIYFKKNPAYHFLLFGLYFPIIQLANYPYLTMRDVYLHAAPAKTILSTGQLTYSENLIPASWPSSFNLHAILTSVSGLDLINVNYILYLSLIIVLILVLYSFGRTLEKKGYRLGYASALLFLCLFFNHNFSTFQYYSRTAFAFILLFLLFFSFMHSKYRHDLALRILLVIALVITHPFQSLALVSFILAYVMLSDKIKPTKFFLFSLLIFLGWMIFQCSSTFLEAIGYIETAFSPAHMTPMVETLATGETLPWWGIILRDYYKYSLVTLLATAFFATIIVLFRNKRRTAITIGLSSVLVSSIVMLFGLILLPDWQITRFVLFAAFPASFSSLILLEGALKKETGTLLRMHNVFTKKSTLAILLIFIVSLSATVMVSNFEKNYYFGELCHPSELSSLAFFFTHDSNSTVYFASWRTQTYSPYFDYNSSHQLLRIWYLELHEYAGNSSKLLFSQSRLINQSQFVIRGMRDSFTYSQLYPSEAILKVVDEEMIIPRFGLIYSNGYYSIYKRSVSP